MLLKSIYVRLLIYEHKQLKFLKGTKFLQRYVEMKTNVFTEKKRVVFSPKCLHK